MELCGSYGYLGSRVGGCAALGGKLYAVGGGHPPREGFDSVEVYDPIDNSWNYVAPMEYLAGIYLACAALGGKLYAVGGQSSTGNPLELP